MDGEEDIGEYQEDEEENDGSDQEDEDEEFDDEDEGEDDENEDQVGDDDNEGGGETQEYEEDGMVAEEEAPVIPRKRPAISTGNESKRSKAQSPPVSATTSELDELLMRSITSDGQQLKQFLQMLGPEQKQLAKSTVETITRARGLIKRNELDVAFSTYLEGMEMLSKLLTKLDAPQISFEHTMKLTMYQVCRLSRKVKDWLKATERLFAVVRPFIAKFKSSSSLAVGLCLCARIGSTAMSNMKVTLQARVEKTRSTSVIMSYYQGRLASIEGKTDAAMASLLDAYRSIPWSLCDRDPKAFANKKRCFERLVPFGIISGRLPKSQAIAKFGLGVRYDRLIQAAKAGDLVKLRLELDKNEGYFSRLGCASLLRVRLSAVAKQHMFQWYAKLTASKLLDLKVMSKLKGFQPDTSEISNPLCDEDRLDYIICLVSDLVARDVLRGVIDSNFVLTLDEKLPFPSLKKAQVKPFKQSKW